MDGSCRSPARLAGIRHRRSAGGGVAARVSTSTTFSSLTSRQSWDRGALPSERLSAFAENSPRRADFFRTHSSSAAAERAPVELVSRRERGANTALTTGEGESFARLQAPA